MKISAIRSDKVYSKIMSAPLDKKNDIYRYELMKPFEKKWACYSVPMKALTPNGCVNNFKIEIIKEPDA